MAEARKRLVRPKMVPVFGNLTERELILAKMQGVVEGPACAWLVPLGWLERIRAEAKRGPPDGFELQNRIVDLIDTWAAGSKPEDVRTLAVAACLTAAARIGFLTVPLEAAQSTIAEAYDVCADVKAREDHAN